MTNKHDKKDPGYPYNLWVTQQYRERCGKSESVPLALGPGAKELYTVITSIINHHCSSHGATMYALREIAQVFEGCEELPLGNRNNFVELINELYSALAEDNKDKMKYLIFQIGDYARMFDKKIID